MSGLCKEALREARKYSGSYKGVGYEISHHGIRESYRPEGTWCYYLLIHEDQLPEEYREAFILKPEFDKKGRVSHRYYDTAIADLDWHCGITYYSKLGGADGEKILIKMGCDYAHYWDEGHSYDESILKIDAERSIDKLFELFPEMKIRSHFYGGFYKPSEGDFNEYGNFVAFSEKEKWAIDHPSKEKVDV